MRINISRLGFTIILRNPIHWDKQLVYLVRNIGSETFPEATVASSVFNGNFCSFSTIHMQLAGILLSLDVQ